MQVYPHGSGSNRSKSSLEEPQQLVQMTLPRLPGPLGLSRYRHFASLATGIVFGILWLAPGLAFEDIDHRYFKCNSDKGTACRVQSAMRYNYTGDCGQKYWYRLTYCRTGNASDCQGKNSCFASRNDYRQNANCDQASFGFQVGQTITCCVDNFECENSTRIENLRPVWTPFDSSTLVQDYQNERQEKGKKFLRNLLLACSSFYIAPAIYTSIALLFTLISLTPLLEMNHARLIYGGATQKVTFDLLTSNGHIKSSEPNSERLLGGKWRIEPPCQLKFHPRVEVNSRQRRMVWILTMGWRPTHRWPILHVFCRFVIIILLGTIFPSPGTQNSIALIGGFWLPFYIMAPCFFSGPVAIRLEPVNKMQPMLLGTHPRLGKNSPVYNALARNCIYARDVLGIINEFLSAGDGSKKDGTKTELGLNSRFDLVSDRKEAKLSREGSQGSVSSGDSNGDVSLSVDAVHEKPDVELNSLYRNQAASQAPQEIGFLDIYHYPSLWTAACVESFPLQDNNMEWKKYTPVFNLIAWPGCYWYRCNFRRQGHRACIGSFTFRVPGDKRWTKLQWLEWQEQDDVQERNVNIQEKLVEMIKLGSPSAEKQLHAQNRGRRVIKGVRCCWQSGNDR